MPSARSVPISRVRSRMAIQRVFMIPTEMTTSSTKMSRKESALSASTVHFMKEISSSQLVMSSFCPDQPSRATDWNFCQKTRGSLSIREKPSFASTVRSRACTRGTSFQILQVEQQRAGGVGAAADTASAPSRR